VGITSLSLEHQEILGHTLEQIALNKAGIMKEKVPAFTVHNHFPHILKLLKEHALNIKVLIIVIILSKLEYTFILYTFDLKCPFDIAPPLEEYPMTIDLGVDDGKVSRLNAALAIQLANSFLLQKYPHVLQKSQSIDDAGATRAILPFHTTGLQSTNFPGRFQVRHLKI